MADGFVADSGIRAQLSSLESSVSGLASVIPTQEMGRFTDYLFELQRQTGMTNSEIEQYRQSLEKLSRITKTYSQRDLAQVNAELRKNTVAFRMLGRETESYIKMLSTAFPTGANKANQSILSLQKNIPELFTLMKAGQRDVATLFEIMQTGGEEALSTYMAIIDATGDRRQLDAINKLSIAWNEYSKNVEDLELRISSVAAETVLAFSESAKGVSSIGAAAGVAIKQVTKLGGAMTNLISTAAMLQMSGLVNIGGLKGAVGSQFGGVRGLMGRFAPANIMGQAGLKLNAAAGTSTLLGGGLIKGAGALAGVGGLTGATVGIGGGAFLGDMIARGMGKYATRGINKIFGTNIQEDFETSLGSAWQAATGGGIRMKNVVRERGAAQLTYGELQERGGAATRRIQMLSGALANADPERAKSLQQEINKLLEKQGQYRSELIKRVQVEFAVANRQRDIVESQNNLLQAQVDYAATIGIGLDKIESKSIKVLQNRAKLLKEDESILRELLKQEKNLDRIKSINDRLAQIEKEKLTIYNDGISATEKLVGAKQRELDIEKSIFEVRKEFLVFQGQSVENTIESFSIKRKELEQEAELLKMRIEGAKVSERVRKDVEGTANREKLYGIRSQKQAKERELENLTILYKGIESPEFYVKKQQSYEGRKEHLPKTIQYLKNLEAISKQIEGGRIQELQKELETLNQQESSMKRMIEYNEEEYSIHVKSLNQQLKNINARKELLEKEKPLETEKSRLSEIQIEGELLKSNAELEEKRFKNIDTLIQKEKDVLQNYKDQYEQLKKVRDIAKQAGKTLPEQRRIQTQMTGMQQQIQGQELKIALAPIVQREKELNVLNAILDSSKSIVDSFKAPVEYIANYTRQQVSISQENMKLQEQKLTEMMKQEGVNQNDLLEQVSKVREAGAKTASLMDQYKRTWEEKFTQFTLGMSTGTYIYKADTSRMAKLGPAFQPWRNTDRGLGTREAIMEGLGMGGRERTKVEIEIAKQLARIAAAFEDQGFEF